MREIVVELRDLKLEVDPIEVKWEVEDNPLGLEWFYALKANFIGPDAMCPLHPLEKSHCLNGWVKTLGGTNNPGLRDIPTLCDELNWAVKVINEFYKDKGYPHIDLLFTPEGVTNEDTHRDLLNQLHHHFELLIGQVWDVSDWFRMANNETIYAIRVLNNNCHQIENIVNQAKNAQRGLSSFDRSTLHQSIMLSFNGINWLVPDKEKKVYKRYSVTNAAYDYWSPSYEWGHLYAYYCQLGKRHEEVFYDGDEHIDHKNISGIRYFTGEATMNMSTMFAPDSRLPSSYKPEFVKWLVDNGFDPNDKAQAYGHGVVARIQLPMDDHREYHKEITKRNDVHKFGWRENGVEYIRTFDYTWKEQVLGEIKLSKEIDDYAARMETKRAG